MTRPSPTKRANPWAPYEPSKEAPWDFRRAAHLHRRAGFAATWGEILRDVKDGPEVSVQRVLAGEARGQGVPDDFASLADRLGERARDPEALRAWWVYRMLFGPDALGERLTLMWHNHFATALNKVGDHRLMHRQNETLRRHARRPFADLLGAVLRDPALLLFLDAPVNRKGHPNENLARELMELFTLGVGPYTEKDVKEAARALTGWGVTKGEFAENAAHHDDGEKTILGRRGPWQATDLIPILLGHPATPRRIAERLCGTFMGEGVVDEPVVASLAEGLRSHSLDVGWGVGTILRSRAFFAEANLGTRVLGPAEFIAGTVRALELFTPPPSTLVLANWSRRLGQDLFEPPDVGGWPGGRHWISTRTLIGRARFAADLVEGKLGRHGQPLDALGLARKHGRGKDLEDLLTFYAELLEGKTLEKARRGALLAALGTHPSLSPETARKAAALLLAQPEAQLG